MKRYIQLCQQEEGTQHHGTHYFYYSCTFKLQHRVCDFLLKLSKNWNSPSVRSITRPIRQVRVQNLILSGTFYATNSRSYRPQVTKIRKST